VKLTVTIIVVLALAFASAASADNYGGVSSATKQRVLRELARYPGWSVSRMACIVGRESGFNPRAVNWNDANGGSHGLGQINGIHRHRFANVWHLRYTIRGGVEMMYRLWRASGYSPWYGGSRAC
jgi:hypothetical protein